MGNKIPERLVKAVAEAIFDDINGWLDPGYTWKPTEFYETARCAISAYVDAEAKPPAQRDLAD